MSPCMHGWGGADCVILGWLVPCVHLSVLVQDVIQLQDGPCQLDATCAMAPKILTEL